MRRKGSNKIIKVYSSEEYTFPQAIAKRAEAVMVHVNSEPKNILYGLLLGSQSRTDSQIRNEFEGLVGTELTSLLTPEYRRLLRYPVRDGLTSEQMVQFADCPERISAWKMTRSGISLLKPIAVFTLKYAVDNNTAIGDILGKRTSPYNRSQLLNELSDSDPISRRELEERTGMTHSGVRENVRALEKIGFAIYDPTASIITEDGQTFFEEWIDRVYSALEGNKGLDKLKKTQRQFERDSDMRREYATKGIALFHNSSMNNQTELTPSMLRIVDFLKAYQKRHGNGPTLTEIRESHPSGHIYLPKLFKVGVVNKKRDGINVRYSLDYI